MALGVPFAYCSQPPSTGLWVMYGPADGIAGVCDRCLTIIHCPESWRFLDGGIDIEFATHIDGLSTIFPQRFVGLNSISPGIPFDIAANAFYFLSSWSERFGPNKGQPRRLYANSIFAGLDLQQDIVDHYLDRIINLLHALCDRLGIDQWKALEWPETVNYAVILSHDIDFIPTGRVDITKQGAKTILRHLIRHQDPADAVQAAIGLLRALLCNRDPYGRVHEIIAKEIELETRVSFQVAVGHRHPNDVNYRIEDDRIREYLRAIPEAGFDLCLHGSYRSTENPIWYVEEVELLAQRLGRPLGSRQHFLSFDYDSLFAVQEQAGIQYDMSMGFPDRTGPRAGFSYPYFPYCLKKNRPYNVLQLNLFLMDVTLRSYLKLKGPKAWER